VRCRQPASDVAENLGKEVLVRSVQARGMTELIPTVKMETRFAAERSLGNKFPLIYNHWGLWRPEVERR